MCSIFHIKVHPNSKQNKITKISDTQYKVHLTTPPTEGKANKHLIKILSKYFKTAKSNIEIIKGKKLKNKLIEIKKESAQ